MSTTAAKIPPITMSKLYIGNLPSEADETGLRQLFLEQNLSCTSILVKRGGYAFVDCPDQSSADKVIDKLNGFNYQGSPLTVEPSVAGGKKSLTCKVLVSNIERHVKYEELMSYLTPVGTVKDVIKLTARIPNTQTVQVTFDTPEEAQQACMQLNGMEVAGLQIKVDPLEKKLGRKNPRGVVPIYGRPTDFPLRILVQSDMVGAIIGRQGTTIRNITQQTRARVDVHRKDNVGSLEKAITIYGNPENCTNACKRILDVMQQEANNTNKGEISLKILAHNNLIGRIIGKGGNTIKRIMQETDTKITVSSINDINSFNLERIITVKGSIEDMSRAEAQISSKLRQSYENDVQAMAPQTIMFPGLHPMAMMSTAGMGYGSRGGMYPGQSLYPGMGQTAGGAGGAAAAAAAAAAGGGASGGAGPPTSTASDSQETTYLCIPNNAVGAIIGTKGSNIRNIIRFSGASVKIAPLDQDKPQEAQTERKVTIIGSPESQWKAQYLIFEKMREEGFVTGLDDVRLTVEILVPSAQVGRIIGKGGQNVRDLQRVTGSVIKLPEQRATPLSEEETTVHIIGPFYSVQSAQRRIRALVSISNLPAPGPQSSRRDTSLPPSQSQSVSPPQSIAPLPPQQPPQQSAQQPQQQPSAAAAAVTTTTAATTTTTTTTTAQPTPQAQPQPQQQQQQPAQQTPPQQQQQQQ